MPRENIRMNEQVHKSAESENGDSESQEKADERKWPDDFKGFGSNVQPKKQK